jgi:hypothetical protein
VGLDREADGYTFATLSAGLDRKAPWFRMWGVWHQLSITWMAPPTFKKINSARGCSPNRHLTAWV